MFGKKGGLPNLKDLLGIELPGPPKGPPRAPRHPGPPKPSGPGCTTGPDLSKLKGPKKGKKNRS